MAGFWICLVKISEGFEYAYDSKCQGSKYDKVVNMRGLYRMLNMHEMKKPE